jgi:Ni,Fe-hydrogenase III large subunit
VSYTLALGPFTPYWRSPFRLVLKVEDERVVDVDYRGGYNERGCAERLPQLALEQALHLVSRISGTSSHAHVLAFCQALEALNGIDVPARAQYMRCIAAEIERAASHLVTLQTLFEVLGLQPRVQTIQALRTRLREGLLLLSQQPGLPQACMPGGVRHDVDDVQYTWLLTLLDTLSKDLFELIDRTIDENSLLARTFGVGTLAAGVVEQFGLRGPLARAAGVETDTRLDQPYAAYDRLMVRRVVQKGGDVHSRLVLLLLEAFESLKLATQALQDLPAGACLGALPAEFAAGTASVGVEGPRGLLGYTLHSDGYRLLQVTIDAPRQLDRLLARTLFVGALVDDVVLIALSTDICTACAEG